ncbi:MAG: DsrE family protein [Dehalococcoidales bacterium]|nr:DsrE family protein [Dehalococcoidales bacterium]
MSEEINKPAADEKCDDCVVDVAKLKERRQSQAPKENAWSALILLTRGTYGNWDDAFSAVQVGNAVLAVEDAATMLLIDDGVYFAVRDQDSSGIGMTNNTSFIQDFIDLGGRMLALNTSLQKRGLTKQDMMDGVEVITPTRMSLEIAQHSASVTF